MLKHLLTLCLFIGAVNISFAQTAPAHQALDAETLKKANDPMAHTKTFNIHNYIISSINGAPDYAGNQLLFRYAQPIGKFIIRATMPVIMSSAPNESPKTGLGDLNIFGMYVLEKNGNKLGFGPQITMPTGTNNRGSEKWQAGVSALAFFARNPVFQGGALLQWQMDFAGSSNAPHINQITSQLFGILQVGSGFYLRSTGIWSFDLEGGNYNIPLGLGAGKIVKVGSVILNIFAEPQFSVVSGGTGQPRVQTFIGFNTQF